ncbi:ParA family protein [Exiguobacterium sp. s133]|uniref:ParA family protein n=1 Tax=Exiguobacterium sp. s133 TaxID=2751213 RepID=UPI001BEAB68A|nr:ParA family protein [Exiguobacterium sp. s133]
MTAKVIAVSSNKGGVLKTSVTTNLAGVIANKGKRVLIIDVDSQSNVALTFGQNPDEFKYKVKHTVFDLLTADHTSEFKLDPADAIMTVDKNIDLMATNDDMVAFEFTVLEDPNKFSFERRFFLLKEIVDELRELYDFILIDTPPNLGLTQGNVLTASDGILIPFQPETYSMRSLIKILKVFREFKEDNNSMLEIIGVVPTMVKENTMIHRNVIMMLRDYGQIHGIRIARNHIPNSIQYSTSVGYDERPITISKPKDKLSRVYFELVKELDIMRGKKNV